MRDEGAGKRAFVGAVGLGCCVAALAVLLAWVFFGWSPIIERAATACAFVFALAVLMANAAKDGDQ